MENFDEIQDSGQRAQSPANRQSRRSRMTSVRVSRRTRSDSDPAVGFRSATATLLNAPKNRSLTWEEVTGQEQDCIETLRDLRVDAGSEEERQTFSVAFSGGGIRAAAFQAGVLWRLAEEDRLRDVEYLAAVSGGGYIASAFATHCLAEPPPDPGHTREFYLQVVAKALCRMQSNAGGFVRDCWATPGYEGLNAGCLPRAFDLPILLLAIAGALFCNPTAFFVAVLVPGTVTIDMFFGPGLRAGFCQDTAEFSEWVKFLRWHSPLNFVYRFLFGLICANLGVWFLKHAIPACRRPPDLKPGAAAHKPKDVRSGYLWGHAAHAFLNRFVIGLVIVIFFVQLTMVMENWSYTPIERHKLCNAYINGGVETSSFTASPYCSSHFPAGAPLPWWNSTEPVFKLVTKRGDHFYGEMMEMSFGSQGGIIRALGLFTGLLLLTACCFCLLVPCLGGSFVIGFVAKVVGPALIIFGSMYFVQFVVFGPITGNGPDVRRMMAPRDEAKWWNYLVHTSLLANIIFMPFYDELRSGLHMYYKACLQKNFFKDGKDRRFSSLSDEYARPGSAEKSDEGARYCPFMVLTATSSDYQSPGRKKKISEISLSSLHCGSEETGYIAMPKYRSLAKCTALTGAGCLDAISLSMKDTLAMRFWLEFLNLSWGDFILFEHSSRIFDFSEKLGKNVPGFVIRLIHRAPAGLCWEVFYILQFFAYRNMRGDSQASCETASRYFCLSMAMVVFLLMASFFSFCRLVDVLSLSAVSRLVLQATKYYFIGTEPPRMLYVTDGGVADCTAIIQLMRRRCKRILLVLAAGDSQDDLVQLRTAMDFAQNDKIGSFFDPEMPERSISVLLDAFKEDDEMIHLHLGICYSWDKALGSRQIADLYVVKNRVTPEFCGVPVQPPLTPGEITGECSLSDRAVDMSKWGDLTTSDLGPFGCCDCCHTRNWNCGPKFPHGAGSNYLYLTPMFMSSLVRLGYAMSAQAVKEVTAVRP